MLTLLAFQLAHISPISRPYLAHIPPIQVMMLTLLAFQPPPAGHASPRGYAKVRVRLGSWVRAVFRTTPARA